MSKINTSDSYPTEDYRPPSEFSQEDFIGKVFGGKYKVIGEISKGGMGRIFKAEQISLRRNVALKVVLASDDQQANQRFLLEASLTASLDHPNIVKIFDFGRTQDGILFLVMELLTGQDLKAWVKKNGPLSIKETILMAKHLCGALSEAHRQNVIHRDIKPTNVMLSKKAGAGLNTKLIDFGLVKNVDQTSGYSMTGVMLGTPMYMSPEQITAKGIDDRADIYAIGLTMYYALTGKIPYPNRGLSSLIHAHLSEDLPSLQDSNESISESHIINWIISSAVAKDVSNRFQNTLQMLEALEVCEQFITSEKFPNLEIQDGSLVCTDKSIEINPELPQSPLVQSGSYVGDGSSLSDDFVNTLSLEVGDHFITSSAPGFESFSGMGPHSLASKPASVLPQPANTEPPKSSKSYLLGIPLVLMIGIGGFLLQSKEPAPIAPIVETPIVRQHEITIKSVPTGADLYIDESISGSTPAPLKIDQNQTLDIRLSLKGYEDREFTISKNSPSEMVIQLRKIESEPTVVPPKPIQQKVKKPSKKILQKKKKTIDEKPKKEAKPNKKGELKETEWD